MPTTNSNYQLLHCALAALVLAGCGHSNKTRDALRSGDPWSVTELRADQGRDTVQTEAGEMYHNYYFAVVLERSGESIRLLYVNRLPEGLELKLGEEYFIAGIDTVAYSKAWRGYWIHDVDFRPGKIK